MAGKFRSLLPPSALHAERALEQASTENILTIDADMIRKVKNPDTCPSHLLPWLAWEFAVDFWDYDWSEEQKRQVLRDAAYVHRHRGTAGAIRRSLSVLPVKTSLVEWWQENPRAAPYTFRIELYTEAGGVSASLYSQVRALVARAKNLRSHLNSIDVLPETESGDIFIGAGLSCIIDIEITPSSTPSSLTSLLSESGDTLVTEDGNVLALEVSDLQGE